MRSPRREAASARKKRHQELASERRAHKERAAAARKATAGGGANALVAQFQRDVASFDFGDGGQDPAALAIFKAADASAAVLVEGARASHAARSSSHGLVTWTLHPLAQGARQEWVAL